MVNIKFKGAISKENLLILVNKINKILVPVWKDDDNNEFVQIETVKGDTKMSEFTFQNIMAKEILAKLTEAENTLLGKISKIEENLDQRIKQINSELSKSEDKIKQVTNNFQQEAQKKLDSLAPRIDQMEKNFNSRLVEIEHWRVDVTQKKQETIECLSKLQDILKGVSNGKKQ